MTDPVIGNVAEPSNRIWTIPNVLSMVRLTLVPVFLGFLIVGDYVAALVVLVVASVSDALDGFIARALHQISNLGILLDPAADRLYILAALIGLAWQGWVPLWLVVVIVGRDVLIVVLGLLLWKRGHMGKRGEKGRFRRGAIPVTRVGKTATFLLFFGLPVIMLGAAFPAAEPFATPIGWTLTLAGAVVYWMAGIDYALRTRARGKAPTVGSNSHGSLD